MAASLGYQVLTVEALAYNTQLIERSIASNQSFDQRVELVHRALVSPQMFDDGVTTICLEMPAGNGDNGIVNPRSSNEGGCTNQQPTRTTTIDRLTHDRSMFPVAIKMDIEGFEAHALAGAVKLLNSKKAPCFIWFEYVQDAVVRSGAGRFDMLNQLAAGGIEVKEINPKLTTVFTRPWGQLPKTFFGEARNMRSGCELDRP